MYVGSIFVAGSAWAILSQGGDWRTLTLVTAAPVTLGLAVSICYLPESPRYLLEQVCVCVYVCMSVYECV
jgi:hypothetical protein